MRHATTTALLTLCIGVPVSVSHAEGFSVHVDLERLYGGIVGDFSQDAAFDFGLAFDSIQSVCLHLEGWTDVAGSTLRFETTVDGVPAVPVELVADDATFDVSLSLPAPASMLDGAGVVNLTLWTSLKGGADLSATVTSATLVTNAVPTGGDTCVGDVDVSGGVGFVDLLSVLSAWGACGCCPQDLDGSGDVGFGDLLTVLAAWGPC